MKKYLAFILFAGFVKFSQAQDSTLPKGNTRIYLHSGKVVKDICLWRVDTSKVEFVQDGNLTDIKIIDIDRIEAGEYLIVFNSKNKMIKRQFDLIILDNGDTLYACIQKVSHWEMKDILTGNNKKKYFMKIPMKSYVQRNAAPFIIKNKN